MDAFLLRFNQEPRKLGSGRWSFLRSLLTPIALAIFFLLHAAPNCGKGACPNPKDPSCAPTATLVTPTPDPPQSCTSGQTLCGTECVSLQTEEHCGGCDTSCTQMKAECMQNGGLFKCVAGTWGGHPNFASSQGAESFRAVFGSGKNFIVLGGGAFGNTTASVDFFATLLSLRNFSNLTSGNIQAIWAGGADQIYAVGAKSLVLKRKPGDWSLIKASETTQDLGDLSAVWSPGDGTIYVAGTKGLWSYSESAPTANWQSSIGEPVRAICGMASSGGPSFAYALGDHKVFFHDIGTAQPWTANYADLKPDFQPTALWGMDAERVIVVGKKGMICEYQKMQLLSCSQAATNRDLFAVFGVTDSNLNPMVYAVGQQGTIVKRQAAGRWVTIPSPTDKDLFAVWGSDAEHFIAVGAERTVIIRSPDIRFRQGPPATIERRR